MKIVQTSPVHCPLMWSLLKPWLITGGVGLGDVPEVTLLRFLPWEVTFSFSILCSSKVCRSARPTLKEWGLCSTFTSNCIHHLEFFCIRDLSVLITQSFIHVDSWIFYTLSYNLILLYFAAQIVPALAFGGSFRWAPVSI